MAGGGAAAWHVGPPQGQLVAWPNCVRRGGCATRLRLAKPCGGMRARTSAFIRGLRSKPGEGAASAPPPAPLPHSAAPPESDPAAAAAAGDGAAYYNARAWRLDAQNSAFPEEVRGARPKARRD